MGRAAYNPASRFLDEIPQELVDWRRIELGDVERHPQRCGPVRPATAPAPRPGHAVVVLEPGDRVTHDTFGLGVWGSRAWGAGLAPSTSAPAGGVKRHLLRYAPVTKL